MSFAMLALAVLPLLQASDAERKAGELAEQAYAKMDAGDLDGAALLLDEVVKLVPSAATSYLMRADFRVNRRRKPAEGIKDLDKAIALGVTGTPASRAHLMRSEAYQQLLKFGPAMEDAQKALVAAPKDPFARINHCLLAQRMGADDEVVRGVAAVYEVDPGNRWVVGLRAQAHFRKGRLDAARADYLEALRQYPASPVAAAAGALVLVAQGKPDEARAEFEKAVRATGSQYGGLWIWKLALERGDRDGARAALDGVLRSTDAGNAWYRSIAAHLAGTLSEEDLLKAAASDLPIEQAERLTEAHFFAGARLATAGDRAGAAERFGKAKAGAVFALEPTLAEIELKRLQK